MRAGAMSGGFVLKGSDLDKEGRGGGGAGDGKAPRGKGKGSRIAFERKLPAAVDFDDVEEVITGTRTKRSKFTTFSLLKGAQGTSSEPTTK